MIRVFLIILFLFFTFSEITKGEAIFLTNGEIIEGTLIKETENFVEIKQMEEKKITIPRKEILRILFTSDYKNNVYIYLNNGDMIKCYIVDEDATSYTYRVNLKENKEIKLSKSEIKIVTSKQLDQSKIGLKSQIGSGTLFSTGITFEFYKIEIYISGGLLLPPKEADGKRPIGLPLKLQGSYYFLTLGDFRPYLFGSTIYGVSIKDYESKLCIGGGIGTCFSLLFAEVGYYTVFEKSSFAIGLGIKVNLRT